jgi:hypothetical protein
VWFTIVSRGKGAGKTCEKREEIITTIIIRIMGMIRKKSKSIKNCLLKSAINSKVA